MKAVSTDSSGKSVRGKAAFRIRRPPLVTDFAPCLIELLTSRKANRASMRCARNSVPLLPPRTIVTSAKSTRARSSGLSSSHSWPSTVLKCCERRLERASS
jgi:hypothetical protein